MRLIAIAAIVAVMALSALASSSYSSGIFRIVGRIPGQDMTGHFVIMGLLSAAVNLGFARARLMGYRLGVLRITVLVLLGVTLEECSQQWLPRRSFSLHDLGAGYLGILVAAALVAPFVRPDRERAGPA